MSESDRKRAALILHNIASRAELLADDLEHGRLWPGDYARGLGEISERLRELPKLDQG